MKVENLVLAEKTLNTFLRDLHIYKTKIRISSCFFIRKEDIININSSLTNYLLKRKDELNSFYKIAKKNTPSGVGYEELEKESSILSEIISRIDSNYDKTPHKIFRKHMSREKAVHSCAYDKIYYFCYHQISRKEFIIS